MKISKVFEYYTGDEFAEFDDDIPLEELEKLSESELINKEDGDSSSVCKKKKRAKYGMGAI